MQGGWAQSCQIRPRFFRSKQGQDRPCCRCECDGRYQMNRLSQQPQLFHQAANISTPRPHLSQQGKLARHSSQGQSPTAPQIAHSWSLGQEGRWQHLRLLRRWRHHHRPVLPPLHRCACKVPISPYLDSSNRLRCHGQTLPRARPCQNFSRP